jgi:hypothetical protein
MTDTEQLAVVIVLSWCHRHPGHLFGNRVERVTAEPPVWAFTWAFPVERGQAKREGYESRIAGAFKMTTDYPGCPHCRSRSFFQCGSCRALVCWDGETAYLQCPSCSTSGPLEGQISEMETGTDL